MSAAGDRPSAASGSRRLLRGLTSAAALVAFPLGRWWAPGLKRLASPERQQHGLTIILPGIEGQSLFNVGIARGLVDGGVETAIEIFDWTTGIPFLLPYHLRAQKYHLAQAALVAQRIVDYQQSHPGRPVNLIGHSGGGGLALLALEALPEGRRISRAILLGPAVSPRFDPSQALARTERGIWNFYSPLDALFLGLGTLALGTVDGRYSVSAGAAGFLEPDDPGTAVDPRRPRLHQVRYRPSMIGQFHGGGHFGFTNRVFVAETIAPLLRDPVHP